MTSVFHLIYYEVTTNRIASIALDQIKGKTLNHGARSLSSSRFSQRFSRLGGERARFFIPSET
jgi:hypothetical protein